MLRCVEKTRQQYAAHSVKSGAENSTKDLSCLSVVLCPSFGIKCTDLEDCMQERSSSMSVLLKQYMQSLQLSASKRKRSGAAVESSSQTSCDYPSHHERPCSAEARRRTKRKRAAQTQSRPRRQSSTLRRACKGTQHPRPQKGSPCRAARPQSFRS